MILRFSHPSSTTACFPSKSPLLVRSMYTCTTQRPALVHECEYKINWISFFLSVCPIFLLFSYLFCPPIAPSQKGRASYINTMLTAFSSPPPFTRSLASISRLHLSSTMITMYFDFSILFSLPLLRIRWPCSLLVPTTGLSRVFRLLSPVCTSMSTSRGGHARDLMASPLLTFLA